MFTSSPSGEESVSPGVTTSDTPEEVSVEKDDNYDPGKTKGYDLNRTNTALITLSILYVFHPNNLI